MQPRIFKMPLHIINGDILQLKNIQYIVHQTNCLCVRSHGLSESIAQVYPWSDVYSQRRHIPGRNLAIPEHRSKPGSISIFKNPNHGPHVICLHAQYDFGTPRQKQRLWEYKDTSHNREYWFKQCLEQVKHLKPESLAFPWKIGCGLAGGNWEKYYPMIVELSNYCDVTLVYKPPV